MRANHHEVVGRTTATHAAIALLGVFAVGCSTVQGPPPEPDGASLFSNYCTPCHGVDGHGKAGVEAPSLAGLPAWYVEAEFHKFRDGIRGAHFDDISGLRMRPMSRTLSTDAEITAVAAYIGSLEPNHPEPTFGTDGSAAGDPAKGATTFAVCAACHGTDAKGNQAVNAPPLAYANDWYLLTQLKHFKAGIRGREPRDTTGATMAPMAATLADEQAMRDVIAYIGTLPK